MAITIVQSTCFFERPIINIVARALNPVFRIWLTAPPRG
jgi:hypothetical protein